jgi:hypothetical protein
MIWAQLRYNEAMDILFADAGTKAVYYTVLIGVLAVVFGFEIWMFIHALMNKRISSGRKFWWLVGMLVLHPFVALGYLFTDFRKR